MEGLEVGLIKKCHVYNSLAGVALGRLKWVYLK